MDILILIERAYWWWVGLLSPYDIETGNCQMYHLRYKAGKYSNTNNADRYPGNSGSASPIRIFSIQIFLDTQKYPLHRNVGGFENIGVVRFSLYESELLMLFLSDRN